MATQTIAAQSAVLQFPQSVPATEVSQQELVDLIEARNLADALAKQVKTLEDDIKLRLQAGAPVEQGIHVVELKRNSRRTPAWKDATRALAEKMGLNPDGYCAAIIEQTAPSVWFSIEID